MAAYQFYLQPGKQRKAGWAGDDSHVVFGQKFPGKKGSVRWCIVMMQQPVLLSPKFRAKTSHIFMCKMVYCHDATASSFVAKVQGEVFAYFHAVAIKRYSSKWN
jgi:hypothetical protein